MAEIKIGGNRRGKEQVGFPDTHSEVQALKLLSLRGITTALDPAVEAQSVATLLETARFSKFIKRN